MKSFTLVTSDHVINFIQYTFCEAHLIIIYQLYIVTKPYQEYNSIKEYKYFIMN